MVAADPGLSSIVVERVSGAVLLVDSGGESVVNRSVAVFVACARSYAAAVNTPDIDAEDDAWEAVGDRLIAEIRGIDPDAGADRISARSTDAVAGSPAVRRRRG